MKEKEKSTTCSIVEEEEEEGKSAIGVYQSTHGTTNLLSG